MTTASQCYVICFRYKENPFGQYRGTGIEVFLLPQHVVFSWFFGVVYRKGKSDKAMLSESVTLISILGSMVVSR